jgi:hypothetical protein
MNPMTNKIVPTDSITLGDGKYTVELGANAGRFSFTATRNGEPWRDMSGDGDGLMLAMFHQLVEQKERIAQLERAANERLTRTMRRWDVEDGSSEAMEAEPAYTITADLDRGLPRVQIYSDTCSGEVAAQFYALPNGKLVSELWLTPDIQEIGEQIRDRATERLEATDSHQAPCA